MYSFSKASADRADRLEDYWRDFAFLGLDHQLHIAGGHKVQVRLLTLRMFIELCSVRSPFLVGGRVGPEHIAQILWRISPEYDSRNRDARADFINSIADLPYRASRRAIDRYLDRMLIDKPAQHIKPRSQIKADTSVAAAMIHSLASAYGWSGEEILELPMPRIFQYLKKIQRSGDSNFVFWNPLRDRFVARYMARRKLWKESQKGNGEHNES